MTRPDTEATPLYAAYVAGALIFGIATYLIAIGAA